MMSKENMDARKATARQQAIQLKATLEDLRDQKLLNEQLLQERDDSWAEQLKVLDRNKTLKSNLAEYDVLVEELQSKNVELQTLVESFNQCASTHEVALERIRHLEQELGEANQELNFFRAKHTAERSALEDKDTQNLYQELVGDCDVVTRQQWDGLTPHHAEYLPRPVSLVIIMHTVTPTCSTDEACAQLVRNMQNNFLDNLNYWDLGPSFLIGGNGKVYEGPGWLHVGAHTYGYNKKSIGISFIGNFNNDQPTAKALAAAKALIKCGVANGHLTTSYKVVAHRQLVATESPGRQLYREIRTWPDWTDHLDGIKNN